MKSIMLSYVTPNLWTLYVKWAVSPSRINRIDINLLKLKDESLYFFIYYNLDFFKIALAIISVMSGIYLPI